MVEKTASASWRRGPLTRSIGFGHRYQHPAQYFSVDRQIRQPEGRWPVSGRPQCNHLWCWNGCDHPFPSLPAVLAPTYPFLPFLPFPPSIYFTAWPWQILPPARLSEPAVNRDWDPLVGLGLLTRNACDRLHSKLIRPLRKLQLQLCVEELRQVRHINHCDWVDIHRAIGSDFD